MLLQEELQAQQWVPIGTMEYLQLPMESTRGSFKLMDLLAGQILLLRDLCEPFRLGPNFNMRAVCFLLM